MIKWYVIIESKHHFRAQIMGCILYSITVMNHSSSCFVVVVVAVINKLSSIKRREDYTTRHMK